MLTMPILFEIPLLVLLYLRYRARLSPMKAVSMKDCELAMTMYGDLLAMMARNPHNNFFERYAKKKIKERMDNIAAFIQLMVTFNTSTITVFKLEDMPDPQISKESRTVTDD